MSRASGVVEYMTIETKNVPYATDKAVLIAPKNRDGEHWVPRRNLSMNSDDEIKEFERNQLVYEVEIAKWFCEQEGFV